LRGDDGRVIDRIVFGAEANDDRALVREVDGDGDTPMVPHPDGIVGTPGL
jgi:hypothetical protein